jgi:hypothetical protein
MFLILLFWLLLCICCKHFLNIVNKNILKSVNNLKLSEQSEFFKFKILLYFLDISNPLTSFFLSFLTAQKRENKNQRLFTNQRQ